MSSVRSNASASGLPGVALPRSSEPNRTGGACAPRPTPSGSLPRRPAPKRTGLSHGVYWRDMGVVNLPSGKPTMKLTGGAAAMLARLVPAGHEPHIHVSITDDNGMAQAFVIIEALQVDPARPLP